MPDIYTLLKQDHDELRPMLDELAEGKQGPFERMASELKAHSEAEEKTFYKALESRPETKDLVADGYKEHNEADRLAQELMTAKGSSSAFAAKAKELKAAVDHHIQEEEGQLFEKARGLLSMDEARAIGEKFEQAKHSTMQGAALV